MLWNWQKPDWPNFTWNSSRLAKAEEHFLLEAGVFIGSVKHLEAEDREQLTVEAMSTEAVTTSEIEGEILDLASVQSSIRSQLGLAAESRRIAPAEQGIAEMMIDLYRSFSAPVSDELLFDWHRRLMSGRRDLRDVGCYRTGDAPMQVVSGAIDAQTVHFQAPPSSAMKPEMTRFIEWFNRTTPTGAEPLSALTRAGIAHLYFVSIHPFEDGNGRIARALAERSLAQNLGQPTLIALAATILSRRKAYYYAFEAANKNNEITQWLAWFAGIAIEAQQRTMALIEFILDKTRLLQRLSGQLNERQEKALLRVLREGPEGFKGGLSAANYAKITGASPATTTRDLADMADKGVFTRSGERRHARYHLNIPLRPVSPVALNEHGELV